MIFNFAQQDFYVYPILLQGCAWFFSRYRGGKFYMPAQDVQVLKHSDIICKKKYEKIPIIGTSRLFCSHANLRETVRCT